MQPVVPRSLPRSDFGRRIKHWRHESGLSQEQLATAADLSEPTISSLERGQSDPKLSTIHKIAQALELPPSVFLDISREAL
jgi:transcriptional regulator with XRE-family HTH domain